MWRVYVCAPCCLAISITAEDSRGVSALWGEVHQSTHIHTPHTPFLLCNMSYFFDQVLWQPEALCDSSCQTEAWRHFNALSCSHVVEMEKSSLVLQEEGQFSVVPFLHAATAAALARDSHLEGCMSDAFHTCCVFVSFSFFFLSITRLIVFFSDVMKEWNCSWAAHQCRSSVS